VRVGGRTALPGAGFLDKAGPTHLKFEAFREGFALEYRKFEQLLLAEGVVERQEIVGAYYVNEGSDGDLAVPAES
jgi:hypothetical protein